MIITICRRWWIVVEITHEYIELKAYNIHGKYIKVFFLHFLMDELIFFQFLGNFFGLICFSAGSVVDLVMSYSWKSTISFESAFSASLWLSSATAAADSLSFNTSSPLIVLTARHSRIFCNTIPTRRSMATKCGSHKTGVSGSSAKDSRRCSLSFLPLWNL